MAQWIDDKGKIIFLGTPAQMAVRLDAVQDEVKRLQIDRDAWRTATGLATLTPAEAGAKIDEEDEERGRLQANLADCVQAKTLAESDRSAQEAEIRRLQAIVARQEAQLRIARMGLVMHGASAFVGEMDALAAEGK